MFDYVHFEMDCPHCGAKLTGFQSKDAYCAMETIEPDIVTNFYSSCSCGAWIEFTRDLQKMTSRRETPLTLAEITAMGFVAEMIPPNIK